MIKEIQSKKVLTHHPHAFPTNWDLNPYRGCTIGCKYCFAQYSHKYLGLDDFFKDILVKTDVAQCLDLELHQKSWKREQIKIGGITDLYQHAEKRYELLPKIFDVIKKYRNPIFIQTKSNLILRDFEIIKELSKITIVDIATSISSFDERVRKVIEPGASSAVERMEMLARFKGIARKTVVGFMPIIPLLSDTDENLETTFRMTKELGLDHLVTSILFLRGEVKPRFLQTIQARFPEIYSEFLQLYSRSSVDEKYARNLYRKLENLREKHQLFDDYKAVTMTEKHTQLSLF